MRGKFRNSFEKPEAFVPGQITTVKYELPDVAHSFKKGHRLMIQIQSSWFPLADRNPQKFINIYTANDSDFQKRLFAFTMMAFIKPGLFYRY
jgi:predicted acyl esterase